MLLRRTFVVGLIAASSSLISTTFPVHALAQGRSGGKGGGSKGGSGKGGSGKGSSGKGSSGKAGGAGNSGARGNTGANANQVTGQATSSGGSIVVRHSNGMTEKLINGRYEMTDARGRIIISRGATSSDSARLRGMLGR